VKRAQARGFRVAERVYGLLHTNRLDEAYLCGLLHHLEGQTDEIYCHRDTATAQGQVELQATSAAIAGSGRRPMNPS
jgi:hypothetical protein